MLYQLSYLPDGMNGCDDNPGAPLCQSPAGFEIGNLISDKDFRHEIRRRLHLSPRDVLRSKWLILARIVVVHQGGSVISANVLGRSQLTRLLQLILALRSGRYPNARELAETCEVSRRTIYRDLEALAIAGVPVRYRSDRQGYYLAPDFFFDPPRLDEEEATALIVLAHRIDVLERNGLGRAALRAATKCLLGLPEAARQNALALSELVRDRVEVTDIDTLRAERLRTILQSLGKRRQVRIWYQEPVSLSEIVTKLSPYRLVFDRDVWCLIGRSSLHRAIQTIRVPWIRKAILTDDSYEVPPRFSLDRYLGNAWRLVRGPLRYEVWVRFSPALAPEMEEVVWHPTQRSEHRHDGCLDLRFTVDGLDEIQYWILRYGDQVEVLAPRELRDRIRDLARRVAQIHASPLQVVTRDTGRPLPATQDQVGLGG